MPPPVHEDKLKLCVLFGDKGGIRRPRNGTLAAIQLNSIVGGGKYATALQDGESSRRNMRGSRMEKGKGC